MFYQKDNFFFTRRGSRCILQYNFHWLHMLLLYYSTKLFLNHPISQTSTTKASQILNLPWANYIALTPNHRHFTTFNYDTVYACDFNKYITCDISLPLRNINASTCIFALFHDNKTHIFKQ
jgi:hypothetical protein